MLGYTGTFEGKPRLRPVERHGLPVGGDRDRGARPARRQAILPRRHLRRPAAGPEDGRPDRRALRRRRPTHRDAPDRRRAARADRRLGARPRRRARTRRSSASRCASAPIVSSDVFYNPDGGQYQRWSDRGILAVEMEAAMLFTLGALKKIQAGCLLTVSDVVVEGEFKRISRRGAAGGRRPDDRARAGHGHRRAISDRHRLPRQPGVGQRRDRPPLAGARAPRGRARARGRRALLRAARSTCGSSRAQRRRGRRAASSPSAATARSTRSPTASSARAAPSSP